MRFIDMLVRTCLEHGVEVLISYCMEPDLRDEILKAVEKMKDDVRENEKDNLKKLVNAVKTFIVLIGRKRGVKDGTAVKLPEPVLKKGGIKVGERVIVREDPKDPRKILIEKDPAGVGRKVREGGILRIPNEIARRKGLLSVNREPIDTLATITIEDGMIVLKLLQG